MLSIVLIQNMKSIVRNQHSEYLGKYSKTFVKKWPNIKKKKIL